MKKTLMETWILADKADDTIKSLISNLEPINKTEKIKRTKEILVEAIEKVKIAKAFLSLSIKEEL